MNITGTYISDPLFPTLHVQEAVFALFSATLNKTNIAWANLDELISKNPALISNDPKFHLVTFIGPVLILPSKFHAISFKIAFPILLGITAGLLTKGFFDLIQARSQTTVEASMTEKNYNFLTLGNLSGLLSFSAIFYKAMTLLPSDQGIYFINRSFFKR